MTRSSALIPLAAGALLSACATPDDPAPREIDAVLGALEGAFDNADQYAAADDALKRPPAPGHPYDWIDQQYAEFHVVDAPNVGDHVVYLEWRAGGPEGEISRQRLWVFNADETGRVTGMDFHTFADPAPYAGRGDEDGAFADVAREALTAYPDGCTLSLARPAWDGWRFELNPETCLITARSGRQMALFARIDVEPGAPGVVEYSESGVLEGGAYAFKVPGGPPYRFEER